MTLKDTAQKIAGKLDKAISGFDDSKEKKCDHVPSLIDYLLAFLNRYSSPSFFLLQAPWRA
jgi:hypothetical protein